MSTNVPAHIARAIARGAASTLRVPVDRRLLRHPLPPAKRGDSKPFHPAAGQPVTLAGVTPTVKEGRRAYDIACHVTVTVHRVDRGPLGHLTAEQAGMEGYPSPTAFEVAWVQRHDRAWLDGQEIILRELGEADDDIREALTEFALARYRYRWSLREAWTLHVTAAHDIDQYLAPTDRPGGSMLGYVTSPAAAMPGEPPVVFTSQLDKRWRLGAEKRHGKARAERESAERQARELLDAEERMRRAREAARMNHVDVHDELRLARKYAREHAQGKRSEAAVLRQVERVETIAYRDAA